VSAQHGDLVKSAMADQPKPRRRRQKMLVLLAVGVAAWLVRYRIRNSHGLGNTWQRLPTAPPPAPPATPASAAADAAPPSSSAAPNPLTPQPAHPTAGPATGPVTPTPPILAPAPRDTPAPEAAIEPEPMATADHPVTPAAGKPAPPQPDAAEPARPQSDAAEPAPPTSATAQPTLPKPAPDQPADAQHPTGSGAVPAAGARASEFTGVRADAPFGPGSMRARSDGSSPDPAYVVKGKTATKAFYTPAAAYYTRTRADVWFRTTDDARAAGFTERAPRRHR
jgi:hypothetical protein